MACVSRATCNFERSSAFLGVGEAGGYFPLGAAKNSGSGLFSRQREEVEDVRSRESNLKFVLGYILLLYDNLN